MTMHIVPPGDPTSLYGQAFDPDVIHELVGPSACITCTLELRKRAKVQVNALNGAVAAYNDMRSSVSALVESMAVLRAALDPEDFGISDEAYQRQQDLRRAHDEGA